LTAFSKANSKTNPGGWNWFYKQKIMGGTVFPIYDGELVRGRFQSYMGTVRFLSCLETSVSEQQPLKNNKNMDFVRNPCFLGDLKPTFGWQISNRVIEQVQYVF
jgi:hypothetical protein